MCAILFKTVNSDKSGRPVGKTGRPGGGSADPYQFEYVDFTTDCVCGHGIHLHYRGKCQVWGCECKGFVEDQEVNG